MSAASASGASGTLAPGAARVGQPLCEDRTVLQGYLLNVAQVVANQFVPALDSVNQGRAADCVTVLLRVVESLGREPRATVEVGSLVVAETARLRASESSLAQARDSFRGAGAGDRQFAAEKLEAYLRGHSLGGPAFRIVGSTLLMNGRSKLTVLIEQHGSARLPESFVLRQDWGAGGVQGTTVVTEFALLRTLADAHLKVPRPLLIEPNADVLGAPFMLVSRMGGAPQGTYFDPPAAGQLAAQMAEQLGRLHSLPIDSLAHSPLRSEAASAAQRLDGVAAFRRLHEQLGLPEPMVDLALQWLEAHCHEVRGDFALIHNDLGSHNLLIEGDELAAILDWELAAIGNPAADLGYARHWLSRLMPWEHFTERYRAAGGPDIDELTLDFYSLWSRVRLYTMLLQARAGIAARVIRDMEVTGICADSLPRLLAHLGEDLTRIAGAGGTVRPEFAAAPE